MSICSCNRELNDPLNVGLAKFFKALRDLAINERYPYSTPKEIFKKAAYQAGFTREIKVTDSLGYSSSHDELTDLGKLALKLGQ